MAYQDLQLRLMQNTDEKYRVFVTRGTPTERPIIGVRIPTIRKIAESVPREEIISMIKETPFTFEEVILRGLLIARLPYKSMLRYFNSQVDIIGDWGSCDVFCAALRRALQCEWYSKVTTRIPTNDATYDAAGDTANDATDNAVNGSIRDVKVLSKMQEFFERKIDPLLSDDREFAVRVGLVLMINYYVEAEYLNVIFDRIEQLKDREEYYIRMATAWLLAECLIVYLWETVQYLEVSNLPKWTYNKAISKACESLRVDDDIKDYLRALRK